MLSTETHRTSYYQGKNGMQLSDFINELEFWRANIIKYAYRAGHKEGVDELTDLLKCQEYLQMRINSLQQSPNE